ncbi:MAG: amidohydrolase, partial [Armatimonadota bacterium]
QASENGLNVAVHAIGDRANHILLNALERLAREGIGDRLRHRVEHAQHFGPDDVERFGCLGLIASMQPVHLCDDIAIAEKQLGNRSANMYLFRSLLRAGARLCFGSDAPVESIDPLAGLHAAVARQRRDGTPPDGWRPAERLDVMEALHAYTTGAAYAGGNESIAGTIEPGKLADFVVLPGDLTGMGPEELPDLRVEMTVVNGDAVYER